MVDSFKSFFITFVIAPSILGVGFALTYELLPFLWSLITFKEVSLAFKNVGLTFLIGYVMYLIIIVYKAVSYRFSKTKDE